MSKRELFKVRLSLVAAIGAAAMLLAGAQVASAVSLWNEGQAGLFASKKTFQVGDIIQIRIDETTSADHEWRTERDKQSKVTGSAQPTGEGAGIHNLFGRFLPFMQFDYESEHQADNRSDRRTRLNAMVSAEIVNVLPNGVLQVIARKVIRVNNEEQLIEMTGLVRPLDIGADNIVSSNAVADANIKVNGDLRFSNDDKPGIIERAFSFLTGLFF